MDSSNCAWTCRSRRPAPMSSPKRPGTSSSTVWPEEALASGFARQQSAHSCRWRYRRNLLHDIPVRFSGSAPFCNGGILFFIDFGKISF